MEYLLLLLLIIPPFALAMTRSQAGRGAGYIDLGVVFAGCVFLYAWLPLVGVVLAELGYGEVRDERVVYDALTSDEVTSVGWSYLIFLTAFVLTYAWRRRAINGSITIVKSDKFQLRLVLLIAAAIFSVNFVGKLFFGIGPVESYGESYTQILQYPKEIQQIMSNLGQMEFAITIAVMVFIIAWRPNFHRYVALAVVTAMLWATFSGGSRSFGFLSAFAYFVCISIYVKKIPSRHLVILALGGLALFVFAGLLRAEGDLDVLLLAPFQEGEFVSVFINPIDLARRSLPGDVGGVFWQLYFVDILRFIPQQFLGFEKLDPAIWYVREFFPDYYEVGGGLAFGAIAESVIGFGLIDVFVRGGLLGLVYASVANRCTSEPLTPMKVFIYVWFVVMSYQAIRDSTFSVFPRFFFQVVPVILLFYLSGSAIRAMWGPNPAKAQST